MKKLIIILFGIFIIIGLKNGDTEQILIPGDAIRFRVIANSNDKEDQNLKMKIKDEIDSYMNSILIDTKNIEEARELVKQEIPNIENKIKKYNVDYKVNYGDNYFPEKEFKGITYEEGAYESLVITLGKGVGENWWCVMFPPLCLLETNESSLDNVEYQFFFKKIIDQYQE